MRRLAIPALAALLVLGGCSSEPEAQAAGPTKEVTAEGGKAKAAEPLLEINPDYKGK